MAYPSSSTVCGGRLVLHARSGLQTTWACGRASVGERHRAIAGELHQRCRALGLGVLDELRFVELALVEADRADVEAAALFDELSVHARHRRVLTGADVIGVAPQG